MSHMRELGITLRSKTSGDQKFAEKLQANLELTPLELQRLFAGRLLLSGEQLLKTAAVCETEPMTLLRDAHKNYQSEMEKRVHCMTPFSNPQNREDVLDLIDAYIDAREALARAE